MTPATRRASKRLGLAVCSLALNSLTAQAEEFSFNLSAYEKKPYEISGYAEMMATHFAVDDNAAFANLAFKPPDSPEDFQRYNAELSLNGLYRFDQSSLHFQGILQWQDDPISEPLELLDNSVQEAYWRFQPSDHWQFNLGKKAVKWGKGYAWNPVGFIERPKNPDDPELNREGFILGSAQYTKSLTGAVQSVTGSLFVLPVSTDLNPELASSPEISNAPMAAAKLSLLLNDTDLDFYLRYSSQTSTDAGFSFSTNLASNLEVHGDFAYRHQVYQAELQTDNTIQLEKAAHFQSLLGLRYLTESELTWIVEWLHSPQGYERQDLEGFFTLAQSSPSTEADQYRLAQIAKQSSYGQAFAGQNYLYVRASQKDFADLLYLNGAVTAMSNLNDGSFSFAPELSYTSFKNSEIRLKTTFLQGSDLSEYAEKLSDFKIELRLRLFF